MRGKHGAVALALLSFTCISACELFNTGDSENSVGRGPKAFDPYSGAQSSAVRRVLQMYNGFARFSRLVSPSAKAPPMCPIRQAALGMSISRRYRR